MILHYLVWVFLKGFKTKNPAETGLCGEDGSTYYEIQCYSKKLKNL